MPPDDHGISHSLGPSASIASAGEAFAALLGDGSLVAWGKPHFAVDCSGIQSELRSL